MSGTELLSLDKGEYAALVHRAERAEKRVKELQQELIRWKRARDRWMIRTYDAQLAIKQALPLLEPIAETHERIERRSYGGPPSPLMAVRMEAERASVAYGILKEAMESRIKNHD
jgi:hypothetical protein